MTCNCETTGGPCSKVSTCHMDAAVAEVVEERDALAARLADFAATNKVLADELTQATERLAEAERLLRDSREWITSEAEYDENDQANFVSFLDAFLRPADEVKP